MKELYTPKIDALPGLLVTPERFHDAGLSAADLALGDTIEFEPIQLHLPETKAA